jgi:integrase
MAADRAGVHQRHRYPAGRGQCPESLSTGRAGGRVGPGEWPPRELRHSFVSLLSDGGVSIEDIADLCGHSGTSVTEKIYRHQLRPVLFTGAVVMDRIFPGELGP